MASQSEPARKLLPGTGDYPLPWSPRRWLFPANAAQAVAIHDPSPQSAARSFKPPFGKLESEIRPDGNPDCPQALALLPLLAACDDGYTTEADLQGTPITDVCPVDVSEADIANYPACQQ
jgi:hypothetical protein